MSESVPKTLAAATIFTPEPGEKLLREIRSDPRVYWRDHAVMAVLGMVAATVVMLVIGSDHIWVGPVGAALALGVRGLWLYSEQMGFHWVLSDARLVGPANRQVYLLELENVRRLFNDIQLITKSGDKHLIKHVADVTGIVAEIDTARQHRARRGAWR